MNVENILRVADAIEQHSIKRLGFNMNGLHSRAGHFDHTGHHCGTTACIAGWACAVGQTEPDFDAAAQYLGLQPDSPAADELFWVSRASLNLRDITVPHAVAVLRHLAATGDVDWTVGAPSEAAS